MGFRDLLIAASLKLGYVDTHGYTPSLLPRSIDRGLIEALEASRYSTSSEMLPRSIDRGLIEADGIPSQRAAAPCGFRDLLIAASLKLKLLSDITAHLFVSSAIY